MKEKTLKIVVNGLEEAVDERTTVAHLVEVHGEGDVHLIVERNGRFVPPATYTSTTVEAGDEFELFHPDFGG